MDQVDVMEVVAEAGPEVRKQRQQRRRQLRDEGFRSIHQEWPSTTWGYDEWFDALGNGNLLLAIYSDILKIGWAEATRRGERDALDPVDGHARHLAIEAQRAGAATLAPFPVAFAALAGHLSRTQLARRVQLSRSQVHRLLAGLIPPTLAEMEIVAAAFKKAPTYFPEYRAHLLAAAFARSLLDRPEMSIYAADKLGMIPAAG